MLDIFSTTVNRSEIVIDHGKVIEWLFELLEEQEDVEITFTLDTNEE